MSRKNGVQEEKSLMAVYLGSEKKINYLNSIARKLDMEPLYKDAPEKFLPKPRETDDVL
jgi:hypothetical protein